MRIQSSKDIVEKEQELTTKIGLIGCVKSKKKTRDKAKDLYSSDLFKKRRKYAESNYDQWLILSAKHHLLDPEKEIEPYDETLNTKSTQKLEEWSKIVFKQIRNQFHYSKNITFYIHAGKRYWWYLVPLLVEDEYSCEVPLRGIGLGKQKAWYLRHN